MHICNYKTSLNLINLDAHMQLSLNLINLDAYMQLQN